MLALDAALPDARSAAKPALAPVASPPMLAVLASRARATSPWRDHGIRWPAIASIAAAHILVGALLWADRLSLRDARPPSSITVALIAPPAPPKPVPPAPRVVPRLGVVQPRTVEPPPILAIASAQSSTFTVPPSSPPVPLEVAAPSAPATAAAAAPDPIPVAPPRFDAAYLDNPAPAYPALARRQREEGRVMLRVLVGADGRAERVDIATSSGSERLDRAAQDAVRRWRFVAARRGGEAVAAYVSVPIVFSLDRA